MKLILASFLLTLVTGMPGAHFGQRSVFFSQNVRPATGGTSCTTSGIQASYDADSISATPVTTWPDSSSHHYDMAAYSSPAWAASVIRGHAAVTLNGSSSWFECYYACGSGTGIPIGTITTVYAVEYISGSSSALVSNRNNGDNGFEFRVNSSYQQEALWQNSAGIGNGTTAVTSGIWQVSSVTYNQSTGALAFYLGNSANGTATQAYTITAPIDVLGTNGGNGEFFNGKISLLTITNAAYDSAYQACLVSNRI